MEKMTITEALSEINLIKKKIEQKTKTVSQYLVSAEHFPDPYASEGGLEKFLRQEIQSLNDLKRRLTKVRSAIAKANLENEITVNEQTMLIHDWLTWKREIANDTGAFYSAVISTVNNQVNAATKNPQVYQNKEGKMELVKFKINVDLPSFIKAQEILEQTKEQLDGKLSLKNATILVQF